MGLLALGLALLFFLGLGFDLWSPTALLAIGILAALSGLLSALWVHAAAIGRLTEGWVAKASLGLVALTAIILSEPLARHILSQALFLNPEAFPHAVRLLSFALVGALIWVLLFGLATLSALWEREEDKGRVTPPASRWLARLGVAGRGLGAIVGVVLIVPAAFSFGSSLLIGIVHWSSFYNNSVAYSAFNLAAADLPDECADVAPVGARDVDQFCVVQALHCTNLPPEARIAFLADDKVAVFEPVDAGSAFAEITWLKAPIAPCAAEDRYRVTVETAAAGAGGTEKCTSMDWSRRCWEP